MEIEQIAWGDSLKLYKFRVKLPHVLVKQDLYDWTKQSDNRCSVVLPYIYFMDEKDAVWFSLRFL